MEGNERKNYHTDCVRDKKYADIRKAAQDAIIKEAIAEAFKRKFTRKRLRVPGQPVDKEAEAAADKEYKLKEKQASEVAKLKREISNLDLYYAEQM
jgi:hypothetical protein